VPQIPARFLGGNLPADNARHKVIDERQESMNIVEGQPSCQGALEKNTHIPKATLLSGNIQRLCDLRGFGVMSIPAHT